MGNRRRRPPRRGLPSYGPIQARQRKPLRQGLGGKLKAIGNSQRTLGVLLLFFALFSGASAIGEVVGSQSLGAGALVTEGTVVGVHHGGKYSVASWDVEFVPGSGRAVTANVTQFFWEPAREIGDAVPVRYDPADPAGYVRDDREGPAVFWPICLALLAVGAFVIGVAGLFRRMPAGFRPR